MRTEEELAKAQVACERDATKARTLGNVVYADGEVRHAEVYRLARLGLAAEQAGRDNIESATDGAQFYLNPDDLAKYDAFLAHPAWRKEWEE